MVDILFFTQILFSIFLLLWLYFRITKLIKEQSSSYSDFKHDIPNGCFLLKRWWAEYCLNRRKKQYKNLRDYKRKQLVDSKIKDPDSANSVFFFGADQKGNSLFVKFSRKAFKVVEVALQLTTSDGQLYVLPAYPDTTITNSLNQEWTAAGLKIEFLELQQRWRIVYNGMLRNLARGGECSDDNIEHIRLNFIFVANVMPLRWPEDWSSKLHAEALACEPWKNPEWINKIKLLDYTGFDQWGSMLGQVTCGDGSVSNLYFRGLHQHRWGKHESHEFRESVTLYGVMSFGAVYYLGMCKTKHSFPQIQYGQFRDNSDKTCEINKLGLKLSDFNSGKHVNINFKHKTWVIADDKKYDINVKYNNSITLYYGQPWNWQKKLISVKLEINGRPGIGLIQLCSSYKGPCQTKLSEKLQLFKQPSNSVQKDDYVVRFDNGKCQNENIVGGKGFSLAMLTSIKDVDFVVPKGFCVTVFALELQLHMHEELQAIINDIEDISVGRKGGDLQQCCKNAMKMMGSTPVVEEVKNAIVTAIESLELEEDNDIPSRYAIRSSAVGEDGEETSAAGQNSTYLGIQGVGNIIKSVAMCWASLFSYQSVKYRKQHGMCIKSSMGVCVQKMVDADAAGVMFTRHPTTGDPSSIIITANYGLGESVVSATVEPDTIIVHKSWNNKLSVKSSVAGNKKEKILLSENGVDTIELNDQEKKVVCLSETMAIRLASIGMTLETLFGSARDIEWAVVNENVYFLQARPITTLYTWTDFELMHELDTGVPSDIDMITFANVGEVFPYPLSPLTSSIIVNAFNKAVALAYNLPDCVFFPVVGMKMAMNYYNVLLRQPSKEITLLNKVVDTAICGAVILTPEIHKTAVERNGEFSAFARAKVLFKMIHDVLMNSAKEKTAKKVLQNIVLNAEDFHTADSLYNKINQHYKEYQEVAECHMHTSRVSVTYQMFALALLTKGYKDIEQEHFSDIALLLGSCSDIVSGEVVNRLKKIVLHIKKSEKDEEFRKIDSSNGIDWLKVNCPLAAKDLNNLLVDHGHRCIQEMDFYAEPWSIKPENLVTTLQTMSKTSDMSNTSKTLNAEETVALLKTPKSDLCKWFLKKLVPHSRNAVVRREMTKGLFVNIIHTFRLAYRRLGKLMTLEEYLPSEDLVFFLTNDEIRQLLNHRDATLVQKAFRRKRIFPRLKETKYPEVCIGMPLPMKNVLDTTIDEKSMKIQGTPVCGGSILSRACVITDLSDAQNIQQGDILITYSTDIAWSPYFPLLSGVVTELGGLISHGAVVAREYGLPCIIGAKKATQIFETGDTVLLAADSGVLQLIKKHD